MKKIFDFMKKFEKLLFISAIGFIFAGCSNLVSEDESSNINSDEAVSVALSLSDGVAVERTALPTYSWGEYVYDLSYSYKGGSTQIVTSKIDFSILSHSITLLPGNYVFTLTGYIADRSGESVTYSKVIEGICNIDVTKDTKILPFRMYAVSGLTGNATVNALFPKDSVVVSCKACVVDTLEAAFGDVSSSLETVSIVSSDDKKSVSYSVSSLSSAALHFAVFKFYDSNGKVVYDHVESLYIMGGKTSTSTFNFDSGSYYLKNISVTLNKDGSTWTDCSYTVILKDSDGNEYELTPSSTNPGTYTGSVPEGNYTIEFKDSSSNKTDTGVAVSTETSSATVSYGTVRLPVSDKIKLTAADSSTSENNAKAVKVDKDTYIVPSGKSLDVTAVTGNGYSASDTDGDGKADVTINTTKSDGTTLSTKVIVDGTTITSISAGTDLSSPTAVNGAAAITYTITYSLGDGIKWTDETTADKSGSYTVEESASLIAASTVYKNATEICSGWTISSVASGGATTLTGTITSIEKGTTYGNLTLTPVFVENGKIQYTVKYSFQKVDGTGYESDTVNYPSVTVTDDPGEKTISPKDAPTGFNKPADQTVTVASGTVVEFKYDRIEYTLTLNAGEGKFSSSSSTSMTVKGRYGSTVGSVESPVADNTDYIFSSWNPAIPSTFTADATYTAQYTQKYASYKIGYYYQKTDDSYELVKTETKTHAETGTTVTTTVSLTETEALEYTTPVVTPATVAADGSAEVKVEYPRKTVTISLLSNGGTWSDSSTASSKTLTGKTGVAVGTLPGVTKEDYEFQGFYNGETKLTAESTFPTADITYTAKWNQVNAPYEVVYYEENTSGTDVQIILSSKHTGKAKIGSTLALSDITPAYTPTVSAGFTAQCSSITIAAETTVSKNILSVYYKRNSITYTFKTDSTTSYATRTGKYGTSVEAVTSPSKTGFTFMGWVKGSDTTTSTVPSAFGAENLTFTAKWYSQVQGQGENPLTTDITLAATGTGSSRTFTVTVPYTGTWTYTWYLDGTALSDSTQSIEVTSLSKGKHDIFVEATESGISFAKTLTVYIQ